MTIEGIQVGLDDSQAPLLPPDEIVSSTDNSVDGTPRTSICKNTTSARSTYRRLRQGHCSINRHRQFVFGALYNNIFPIYHMIDPMMGNFDLKITLPNKKTSVLQIRLVFPDDGVGKDRLLSSIVTLGKCFRGPSNARGRRVGDLGKMHAVGVRCAARKELYVETEIHLEKIKQASNLMRHWMEDNMPTVLTDIISNDTSCSTMKPLSFMPRGPGSRLMISSNLANSAHYDTNDASLSVAVWVEEKPGLAKNWYFILPNVQCEGKKGVVVKLCHGTAIAWDGRAIFHCTSKTNPGFGNKVYGCMWGASK